MATHNHITRDIKEFGLCPGCDEYHRIIYSGKTVEQRLFELEERVAKLENRSNHAL